MNPNQPTDIAKHPLLKQIYEVCRAIEELPCSKEQTDLSILASKLLRDTWNLLPEKRVI